MQYRPRNFFGYGPTQTVMDDFQPSDFGGLVLRGGVWVMVRLGFGSELVMVGPSIISGHIVD